MKLETRLNHLIERLTKLESPASFRVQKQRSIVDFIPNEYQLKLLARTQKTTVLLKSRQLGITSLGVIKALDNVFKGGKSVISCPSDSFIKDVKTKVKVAVGHLMEVKLSDNIIFFGDYYITLSNSNFESLRGLNADFVYVTEAGLVKDFNQLLDAVEPLTSSYDQSTIWIDGTVPKTANEYITLFKQELIDQALTSGVAEEGDLMVMCDLNKLSKGREYGLELPSFDNLLKVHSTVDNEPWEGQLYWHRNVLLEVLDQQVRILSTEYSYDRTTAKRQNINRLPTSNWLLQMNDLWVENWVGRSCLLTKHSEEYTMVEKALIGVACLN